MLVGQIGAEFHDDKHISQFYKGSEIKKILISFLKLFLCMKKIVALLTILSTAV